MNSVKKWAWKSVMLLRVVIIAAKAIVEAFRKYAGVNIDDNAFRLPQDLAAVLAMPVILRRFSSVAQWLLVH